KYNDLDSMGADSNLHLPLWQLLRASTAAPIYFPPEEIEVAGEKFIFLDGAITPYNNPAFQAYLMSTLKEYNLNWTKGEENLLVVSVGTGLSTLIQPFLKLSNMGFVHQATKTVSHILNAVGYQQDLLCRVVGKCLVGYELDGEVGDLIDNEAKEKKAFTYLRYNAQLDKKGLQLLGLGHLNPKDLQKLDAVDKVHLLKEVGEAVARDEVDIRHFEGF
ncbi:MAG TPA: patatin, partial [Nitratifractor sp.]|nr:patatin [Nitratifractor sp.]